MTPARIDYPGSPDEWLMHAASDLEYGRKGQSVPLVLPVHVCFHAQQAAEKAMKAVLRAAEFDFPPIHDLWLIANLLTEAGARLPDDLQEACKLTPFAAMTRYPSDWDPIEPHEVEEALDIAGRVLAWAKEEVQQRSSVHQPEGTAPISGAPDLKLKNIEGYSSQQGEPAS